MLCRAMPQEGAGHAVSSAYVEIVFDNSDSRFPVGASARRASRMWLGSACMQVLLGATCGSCLCDLLPCISSCACPGPHVVCMIVALPASSADVVALSLGGWYVVWHGRHLSVSCKGACQSCKGNFLTSQLHLHANLLDVAAGPPHPATASAAASVAADGQGRGAVAPHHRRQEGRLHPRQATHQVRGGPGWRRR